MVKGFKLYAALVIIFIIAGASHLSPTVKGLGTSFDMSVNPISITIDTTTEGDPNSFFVEKIITVTITGDLKDPSDASLGAIAYVTMTHPTGINVMVLDSPQTKSGRVPFQTTLTLGVYKSNAVGTGAVTITVSANGINKDYMIPIKITKQGISVQLDEPKSESTMRNPNIWFNGSVSPAVPGAEVCFEIYHKQPEFKTEEQKMGIGSGIVMSGFTLTDQRGRFALNGEYLAFYNPMGLLAGNQMVDLKSLADGKYWLIYYVSGRVLQPNLYAKADIKNLTSIAIGSANEIYQPTVTRDPNTYLYGDQLRTFNIQEVTNSLTILCKDSKVNNVENAYVYSKSQPTGQTPLDGRSGPNGTVRFKNILPGSYTIYAHGYDLGGDDIEGWDTFTTVAGEIKEVKLELLNQEEGSLWAKLPGYPLESIIIGIVIISLFARAQIKYLHM